MARVTVEDAVDKIGNRFDLDFSSSASRSPNFCRR